MGYPLLSHYTAHSASPSLLSTAYMLLEYIGPETGQMLSQTWHEQRHEPERRRRFFYSLSGIILSLSRVPQPRIGSFQFHDDGSVTLTNRPLSCAMMILENDGSPRTIGPRDTYVSTEAFVSDMLSFHDSRFLSHPNAVCNARDCRRQMAARVALRALSHRYIDASRRAGPYLLQLTDLHGSNVLVDDDWNITCLIDLEWISALPAEMLRAPHWLAGSGIDEICDEKLDEFNKLRLEFVDIFQEREREATAAASHGIGLSQVLTSTWGSGAVWFWHCITSINAMFELVDHHLFPRFSINIYQAVPATTVSNLWSEDTEAVVDRKVAEFETYKTQLQQLFVDEETRS